MKVTLLDLTERNANRIIPSYCHLLVSWISLVDRVIPLGAVSHRFNFCNDITLEYSDNVV